MFDYLWTLIDERQDDPEINIFNFSLELMSYNLRLDR